MDFEQRFEIMPGTGLEPTEVNEANTYDAAPPVTSYVLVVLRGKPTDLMLVRAPTHKNELALSRTHSAASGLSGAACTDREGNSHNPPPRFWWCQSCVASTLANPIEEKNCHWRNCLDLA